MFNPGLTDPDAPEPPAVPVTRWGDVWTNQTACPRGAPRTARHQG